MLENPSTWLRLVKDLIPRGHTPLRILAAVGVMLLSTFVTLFVARGRTDALAPTILTPYLAIALEAAMIAALGLLLIILTAAVAYAVFYRAN